MTVPEVCSRSPPRAAPPELMYNQETWTSTAEEKQLYHSVMLRIEAAMQRLCDEDAAEDIAESNDKPTEEK